MALSRLNIGVPALVTATRNVLSDQGGMIGMFVSAASATPTITVYDSSTTTTTTKIIDTFTPIASTWYAMPLAVGSGIYVVIGGTVSATLVYAP